MSTPGTRKLIAVVAFHGVIPFHLAVPCMVFGESMAPDNPFEVVVCAGESEPIRTTTGFGLCGLAPIEILEYADAIVIPGWRDTLDPPPAYLLDALRAAHRRGTQIVGLCLATHVLASAGLLDGRRATTHWECSEAMAGRFPRVAIDASVLYVEEDNLLTAAGTVASIDACLHVLRQRLGAAVANEAARRMIVAPHREGRQAQCIDEPVPRADGDVRLARLLDSVRERLGEPHTLDGLAAAVRMSRRTFTRHFKALTGTTVKAWLLSERLLRAQRLLETTDQPLQVICETTGFASVASLRLRFQEVCGLSPTAWRSRYRRRAGSSQSASGVRRSPSAVPRT